MSPQRPRCRTTTLTALGFSLLLARPLAAHPGHGESVIPLPAWHTTSGATFTGLFLKSEGGAATFVDAQNRAVKVPLIDLDATGRQTVERATAHVKLINHQPVTLEATTAESATAESSAAEASPFSAVPFSLTGLLVDNSNPAPEAAKAFAPFERVKTRWDAQYLFVESNGLPDHPMMKGITAWQQQVPLLQNYTGDNAWRVPLHPVVAQTPAMLKGRFLRGAVALAVNGIPIFNPQNNRGEVSQDIGELDEYGGHCGRADDYHYHVIPVKLQEIVGKGKPLAYSLDGYPVYGLTEPDGAPITQLDECGGHATRFGYHYHALTKYPYVMAGFHGEVTEAGGQVDPQPRASSPRPATGPLRGASIIGLKSIGKDKNELTYEVAGHKGYVRYTLNADNSYTFDYEDPQGNKSQETYQQRGNRGGGNGGSNAGGQRGNNRPARGDTTGPQVKSTPVEQTVPAADARKNIHGFKLTSPAVGDGGALPVEFTGDGANASPPLQWSGAPAGTTSYAVMMHHIPGPGDVKWYWIVYNIPADVHSLAKNVQGVGVLGTNTVNRRAAYAPPHSKGPGLKTYILTVYALSAAPEIKVAANQVDRPTLLAAMEGKILASAELTVTYDRTSVTAAGGNNGGKSGGDNGGPENGANNSDAPGNTPGNRPLQDGPPSGGSGGGNRGGAVRVLRREVVDALKLTPDQQSRIVALELEASGRLSKILTPEQLKLLESLRPPRPDQPGNQPPPPPPQ